MLVEALIVIFGVPSLIVTLGGMVALQGLLLVVLPDTFTVSVGGTDYAKIANSHLPASIGWLLATVGWLLFSWARLRRHRRGEAGRSVIPAVVAIVVAGVAVFGVVGVLSQGNGLPLPVLILAVMLLVGHYATTQTRYGVHLYAAGGNREAAQRAGIPVSRMIVYSFLVLGLCAAVAGFLDASRLLSVSNSSGSGPLMLNAIAAAVVGGTSLFGGRGTVWAALMGALVIGSINNGIALGGDVVSTAVERSASVIDDQPGPRIERAASVQRRGTRRPPGVERFPAATHGRPRKPFRPCVTRSTTTAGTRCPCSSWHVPVSTRRWISRSGSRRRSPGAPRRGTCPTRSLSCPPFPHAHGQEARGAGEEDACRAPTPPWSASAGAVDDPDALDWLVRFARDRRS